MVYGSSLIRGDISSVGGSGFCRVERYSGAGVFSGGTKVSCTAASFVVFLFSCFRRSCGLIFCVVSSRIHLSFGRRLSPVGRSTGGIGGPFPKTE